MIDIRLRRSPGLIRLQCNVCGGETEKHYISAVGYIEQDGKTVPIRVCETCLESGGIDARLQAHSAALVLAAKRALSFIGRLRVPTYQAWLAAEKAADEEAARELGEEGGALPPSADDDDLPF
jgi:hypothetical protein